ncbi:MAG: phosphoribosylglycinamide formyltransferase [Chloroflexota bacterium]|nr:phosphoribosylglycinamide formyltransferase [Chloroflexota bacterium]
MKIAVFVSGRGTNLQAILDAGLPVDVVVCNVPDAPALERARRAGVDTLLRPDRGSRAERDQWVLDRLLERGVGLLALAGYDRVLADCLLQAFPHRIVNTHPSLLPAFAGGMDPAPLQQALDYGVKVSGCTIHLVTPDVDHGPVLAQACVPVLPEDTLETLGERIRAEEHRLFPQVLRWFVEGQVQVDGRQVRVAAAE